MRSAQELSPKMQISAELYRVVQQLSGPSPLGPGFLINALLEEALRAPEIIDRARLLLAEALRRHADGVERGLCKRRKTPIDTLARPIAPDPLQIQFFGWIQEQVKTTAINHPASSIHTHQDGLLLASPRIFQDFAEATNCSWRDCQKTVFKSDCIETSDRRTIKRYRLAVRAKNRMPYLNCVVVWPEACKDLFGELPAPNPIIVERVSW